LRPGSIPVPLNFLGFLVINIHQVVARFAVGGSGSVNPEREAGKIYETPRGKMKWTAGEMREVPAATATCGDPDQSGKGSGSVRVAEVGGEVQRAHYRYQTVWKATARNRTSRQVNSYACWDSPYRD